MAKKSVQKKTIITETTSEKPAKKKKSPRKKTAGTYRRNPEIDKMLIDNFVSLQKVMVNLSTKFDNLTTQISKLLNLFEISAKTLAEKDFDAEKNNRENARILEKIENVLEQNKTIARGLTLMHDKITEPPNPYASPLPMSRQNRSPQNMPFKPVQKPSMMGGITEEFHRPISPNEK